MMGFTHLTEQYERKRRKAAAEFYSMGGIKFLLLAAFAFGLYIAYNQTFTGLWFLLPLLLLAALVAVWIIHAKIHKKLLFAQDMLLVFEQYRARRNGNWAEFSDSGWEFLKREHSYAADLDIVGEKSLFQMLNVTGTWHGRQRFARDLLHAEYDKAEIRERQALGLELYEKVEFICALQCHTQRTKTADSIAEAVKQLGDTKAFISSAAQRVALLFLPFCTVVLLLVKFFANVPVLSVAVAALLGLQGLLWLLFLRKSNAYLGALAKAPHVFERYEDAMRLVVGETWDTPLAKEIQATLREACGAIEKLDRIVSRMQAKENILLYFPLNVLLLWDIRCAFLLSRWKHRYGAEVLDWFERLGELESLASLTGLLITCEGASMPEIMQEIGIRALQIGHPLLKNKLRVCNDFTMGQEIAILSGSNMSGKTTFLRTVGINLVLARAGGAVCAQKLQCTLFTVLTSMRIADDLNEGISTFYAELQRVGMIIEAVRNAAKHNGAGRPDILFLMDELFRGTNSRDRLEGVRAVLTECSRLAAAGLITTHDLSICTLEKEGAIVNYNFSEQYEGEHMLFDYFLKPGKSTGTNAAFLMRKIGIISET